MEEFAFSRIKTACVDTVVFVVRLAIILGLIGTVIVQLSPESALYWHAAALTVIVMTVAIRSVGFARLAWRELGGD